MKATRFHFLLSSVAIGVCLVLIMATVAFADHSWGGYHWARTANPFTLKLGDNVSSVWDPRLATTASDWSISTVLDTVVVPGSTNPRNCRPKTGRVEVCDSKYGYNGWLGVASIWITGGEHIVQGTVKLNDTYFNNPPYNTIEWRNLVSCQEVGHTLGLAHQDEIFDNPNLGSCMDYTDNPYTNQHPNAHDYEQLMLIYEHLDSTTTVGQTTSAMPPAMTQIELEGPNQWGKLVSESASGSHSVYEADFGNGFKIVTHVTWAPGQSQDRGR
ncbi:MAG: hypothetical protein HY646_10060 [Acidobacteria bacterium]|nr:hypothetical protein [Acidobacteriota bacterium]